MESCISQVEGDSTSWKHIHKEACPTPNDSSSSHIPDAEEDTALAAGGSQPIMAIAEQRLQGSITPSETAEEDPKSASLLENSDAVHLRGDDSGADSPLQVQVMQCHDARHKILRYPRKHCADSIRNMALCLLSSRTSSPRRSIPASSICCVSF